MHVLLDFLMLLFFLFYHSVESVIRFFIPVAKKSFDGKLVLITGAGHGIGRELALQFAALGSRLVLLDINKDNAKCVADEVEEAGGSAVVFQCDVSKSSQVRATASAVQREVGEVDVLVNNAGVLNGGAFLDLTEDDIRRTMDINIMAYMWTCKQFLPAMIRRNEGHIINVASMAGKGGVAYLTDYSASKFAVTGFTEALADEMRREGHDGIVLTCIHPMFVQTGLLKYKRERFGRWLTPKETAAGIIEGAQRNEKSVFIPASMGFSLRLGSLLPVKFLPRLTKFLDLGCDPQYKESKAE